MQELDVINQQAALTTKLIEATAQSTATFAEKMKQKEKEEKELKKLEEKKQQEADDREHVINLIQQYDVYYIESLQKFFRCLEAKDINGNPVIKTQYIAKSNLHETIQLEPKYNSIFFDEIRKQKDKEGNPRTRVNSSFSIGALDVSTLNLGDDVPKKLMKVNKADTKPHNIAFDVLMYTLGGEHEDQIRELRKMIAYRYITIRERSSYVPPIPLIIGKGGTGKNVLFDGVLPEVFNSNYTKTIKTKDFMGEFNADNFKSAITFVDEFEPKDPKEAWNLVKGTTNPTVMCNEKYEPKYVIYNCTWFAIGTNDHRGALKFANTGEDSEDRRILVCKAKRSLNETGKEVFGIDLYDKEINTKFHKTLRNRTEINRWVRDLVAEFESEFFADDGSMYAYTSAYKGPDYYELVSTQETDWKAFVREYMNDILIEKAEPYLKLTRIWDAVKEEKDKKEISFPDKYNKAQFYGDLKNFISTDPRLKLVFEYMKDGRKNGNKIKDSIITKEAKGKTALPFDDEAEEFKKGLESPKKPSTADFKY